MYTHAPPVHVHRYVTAADPSAAGAFESGEDDEDARHQAMGEALAEANERLLAKELERRGLERELEGVKRRLTAAEAAEVEVERLKEENLEIWKSKVGCSLHYISEGQRVSLVLPTQDNQLTNQPTTN
jgi:hypothetical protein